MMPRMMHTIPFIWIFVMDSSITKMLRIVVIIMLVEVKLGTTRFARALTKAHCVNASVTIANANMTNVNIVTKPSMSVILFDKVWKAINEPAESPKTTPVNVSDFRNTNKKNNTEIPMVTPKQIPKFVRLSDSLCNSTSVATSTFIRTVPKIIR